MKTLNFLLLLGMGIPLLANSKNDFSVAPSRIEIDLAKPKTESFIVYNRGDGPIRVEIETTYFPVDSKEMEYGEKLANKNVVADDLSSSIRISPSKISLAPGEQRAVRISIRPGSNLSEGEYRAHLLFRMLETAFSQKDSKTDEKGKKMGMKLSFKLELATAIIGTIGVPPEIKVETACRFNKKGKLVLATTNPNKWRADGWAKIYSENKNFLGEKHLFVLRESKKEVTFEEIPKSENKLLTIKWYDKKEDKVEKYSSECRL
jgi:hypothetical protein